MTRFAQRHKLLLIGIIVGASYGLVVRIVLGLEDAIASVTFFFLVPVILGIIPLLFSNNEKLTWYRNLIFIPWLTVIAFFVAAFVFRLEDIACLLVFAAPFLILASIGAFIFMVVQINRNKNKGKLMTLILLPFMLSPIEKYIESPTQINTIESEIIISATSEKIWDHIVAVDSIKQSEYCSGFFNTIGIPRPIAATVDRRGSGGHRTGYFEGGLKFNETIERYETGKTISFDIAIEPGSVRKVIFDQHVLRGNYFSFVNATYELVPLSEGKVKLKLSSSYRLTSKINFYGKFWGDIILKDFQDRLLQVIQSRCEKI
jgi:hypothetical protein